MPALNVLHGCRTLQLTKGFNTLIDEEDFERVGCFKWHVRGNPNNSYATRCVPTNSMPQQRVVRLHRVLMDAGPSQFIDHRNGDTFDNRKSNLRIATQLENGRNVHRVAGLSRFKGVKYNPVKRFWFATIRTLDKRTYLGSFRTEEQAARAYDAAARERFGEFAWTNGDIYGDY